ncbi:cupin domain-containing protein [Methylocystis sp. H62]|uniref:cupin domain-containing protein n=1 Tax=Methylocystis sp. H62 TaxID=2785789 RepID=UPI0018C299F5|nr:cupin domain-containing protein [Methylocystis sp. H62]MBG0794464.1 cupin domain-containing protein [Methylocystis sp. H62]
MDPKHTIHTQDFLDADGGVKLARWAEDLGIDPMSGRQHLAINLGPRPLHMAHTTATGAGLISNAFLGADVMRLAAGEGFVPHTHPGDHLIITVGGHGTFAYDGKIYPISAGQAFLIEGKVPHAVAAITDLVILAIGSPHMRVDAPDRMTPVEYKAVTSYMDKMYCLICKKVAVYPNLLHQVGCPHCLCRQCIPLPISPGA